MSYNFVNPESLKGAGDLEKPVADSELERQQEEEYTIELEGLRKHIEVLNFQDLVTSRLAVLDQEFGTISDRFHITRIAYTPLVYTPEDCPPTPLCAAYGYALSVGMPDDIEHHFVALGYSIRKPFGEIEIPMQNLLLSPTHTPPGKQDIFGQLTPKAASALERFREAQHLYHPKFVKGARNILNQTLTGEKSHLPYSGSYTTTTEITAQLTSSPEYTDQTFGLGASIQGDRMQAEIALDRFLVDVLSGSLK